jgi:hypothetical protein
MANVNTNFVEWDQFDPAKLSCLAPKNKTWENKSTGQSGSYNELTLQYNYGTPENPHVKPLYIQGPEMTSAGVQIQDSGKGYMEYSSMFRFELDKPSDTITDSSDMGKPLEFAKIIGEKLYPALASLLEQHKDRCGMPHFSAQMAEATGFKSMPYYKRDEGKLVIGATPSQYFKIRNNPKSPDRLIICLPDGRNIFSAAEIPINTYDDINSEKVQITGFPIFKFSHIYIGGGGKASCQRFWTSLVVTDIRPTGGASRQLETAAKVMARDDKLVSQLEEQMAALLEGSAPPISTQASNQSTDNSSKGFEVDTNDAPSAGNSTGNMESIPQQQQAPQQQQVPQQQQAPQQPQVSQEQQAPQQQQVPQVPQQQQVPQVPQTAPQVPQQAPQVPMLPNQGAQVTLS